MRPASSTQTRFTTTTARGSSSSQPAATRSRKTWPAQTEPLPASRGEGSLWYSGAPATPSSAMIPQTTTASASARASGRGSVPDEREPHPQQRGRRQCARGSLPGRRREQLERQQPLQYRGRHGSRFRLRPKRVTEAGCRSRAVREPPGLRRGAVASSEAEATVSDGRRCSPVSTVGRKPGQEEPG
jgi:hypothetical protein